MKLILYRRDLDDVPLLEELLELARRRQSRRPPLTGGGPVSTAVPATPPQPRKPRQKKPTAVVPPSAEELADVTPMLDHRIEAIAARKGMVKR